MSLKPSGGQLTAVMNHIRTRPGQRASVEIKPGACDLAGHMGDADPRGSSWAPGGAGERLRGEKWEIGDEP